MEDKITIGHGFSGKTAVYDLDGTLAESMWPNRGRVGPPIKRGVDHLKAHAAAGYAIVIDTARPPSDKAVVWEWVKKHKLPVDRVRTGKKIAATFYFDDRAWRYDCMECSNVER